MPSPFGRRSRKSPADPVVEDAAAPLDDDRVLAVTEEGVAVAVVDEIHLMNLTDPTDNLVDARRVSLHLNGRTYHHVSETAPDGAWIYRLDS